MGFTKLGKSTTDIGSNDINDELELSEYHIQCVIR